MPAWDFPETPCFSEQDLDRVLATCARLLLGKPDFEAAYIIANAESSAVHESHDRWNGGQDYWRLMIAIGADVYLEVLDRPALEKRIDEALSASMEAYSSADFMKCQIVTNLVDRADWKKETLRTLSGYGVTNQGRVRSDNVAAREHDGLRFRSKTETLFYDALKQSGVPFAPLPVVLHGGSRYRRVEPDFLIFRDGVIMNVEIDGDIYHRETPAEASERLKFLRDEGVLVERLPSTGCDTPEKAREAVSVILATLDKHARRKR